MANYPQEIKRQQSTKLQWRWHQHHLQQGMIATAPAKRTLLTASWCTCICCWHKFPINCHGVCHLGAILPNGCHCFFCHCWLIVADFLLLSSLAGCCHCCLHQMIVATRYIHFVVIAVTTDCAVPHMVALPRQCQLLLLAVCDGWYNFSQQPSLYAIAEHCFVPTSCYCFLLPLLDGCSCCYCWLIVLF